MDVGPAANVYHTDPALGLDSDVMWPMVPKNFQNPVAGEVRGLLTCSSCLD